MNNQESNQPESPQPDLEIALTMKREELAAMLTELDDQKLGALAKVFKSIVQVIEDEQLERSLRRELSRPDLDRQAAFLGITRDRKE